MVHLSFWKHWVSRMSVRGKELICMQTNGHGVPERASCRQRSVNAPEQIDAAEGRPWAGSSSSWQVWCWDGCSAGALVADQALRLWRPLFSLSPLFSWESSGWRQAHSRRLIWKYLEKQDERVLGCGLCQNQPCSADNRLLLSFLLASGAPCGTRSIEPEPRNVHTLAFFPVTHFGAFLFFFLIVHLVTEV